MRMYQSFRTEQAAPQPNKRKAPMVETGGHIPPTVTQTKKVKGAKELNNLANKVYETGRSEDLGNYLDKSGFLTDFMA